MVYPFILAAALALIPCRGSADTASWPFNVAPDYVLSDSTKIEIAGGVARLIPVDQTDDDGDSTGFGGGAHNQTQWDAVNGWLELIGGVISGEFTSRVMDAGAAAAWDGISWTPRRPYLKELPNYGGLESGYPEGCADMAGNVYLAHLNESPCAGGDAVADSSAGSNHGVLYTGEGAADKSVAGKLDTALGFDGADDYVEVPDGAGLDITDAITIEAWINPSAGGGAIGEVSAAVSDTYEFDIIQGRDADVVHVAGDVYAVAYDLRDYDNDGWLRTVRISDDGTIGNASIDNLEFDTVRGTYPDILHVSGDVYAIAYSGPGTDGWLATVQIGDDGTIGNALLDSYEFDPSRGDRPSIVHVNADVYAIAYSGYGTDGWLATVQIAADGSISNSTLDDLEFDSNTGLEPDIVYVAGDVYAIAYCGPSDDGWVVTVQIAADGTIGSGTLASAEFDAVNALAPDIFHVARDVYAVAYCGPDLDGWLLTGHIADDGTISGVVDLFEYDTGQGGDPCVIHISGDVYAIAYAGPGYDGFLSTCEILTARGIVKAGAYGVDADPASAHAWVNNHTISAALSSGWNHVALVYDVDAAPDQQLLYVNGVQAGAATLGDAIESNSSPLILGKGLSGGIDEVAIFNRALSPAEVADHYKRGALRLKYQVRTGSSDPPSGAFVGPDGTAASYYSELSNGTTGLPSLGLTSLTAGRYFQYRAYLETDDISYPPELESASFGPAHYPGDNPTVRNATGQDYVSLLSFVETMGAGNEGAVRYQISNDGSNWYYWNGSGWAGASGYSQTNSAGDVGVNIGSFDEDVGAGAFFFKAFLHSDAAAQQVELDQVDLGFITAIISVVVGDATFAFGTNALDTWLSPDSTIIRNDGSVVEDFLGRISQFGEGAQVWGISPVANGDDVIRAQWSTAGAAGPWTDISGYDADFTIMTNVATSDSVTLWFRIMTPTSTSSYGQYSSTLTVTAQQF